MARVALTPELSSWIAGRFAAFQAENKAHQWLADVVRDVVALRLWLDMGGCYAMPRSLRFKRLDEPARQLKVYGVKSSIANPAGNE
jgi:uncharacterized protein (DUF2342 family)